MKEVYEKLEMEVISFDAEDVIITSIPDDNEGPINSDFWQLMLYVKRDEYGQAVLQTWGSVPRRGNEMDDDRFQMSHQFI